VSAPKILWWDTPLMSCMNELEKIQLLALARASIQYGLGHNEVMPLDLEHYPQVYAAPGASFVTLQKNGELRGCIGTLQAYQALALDIVQHAHGAAFCDPRFPKVVSEELDGLHIEISILGPSSAIIFESEADLLQQLVPLKDGLTIEGLGHKATFLPQVWHNLREPAAFLTHLKSKAGLGGEPITPAISAYRYCVSSFEERD